MSDDGETRTTVVRLCGSAPFSESIKRAFAELEQEERAGGEVTFTLPDDAFPVTRDKPATTFPAPEWLTLLFCICAAGGFLVGLLIGRGIWS